MASDVDVASLDHAPDADKWRFAFKINIQHVFVCSYKDYYFLRAHQTIEVAFALTDPAAPCLNLNLFKRCLRGIAQWIKHSLATQAAGVQTMTPPKISVLLSSQVSPPCALSLSLTKPAVVCKYLSWEM